MRKNENVEVTCASDIQELVDVVLTFLGRRQRRGTDLFVYSSTCSILPGANSDCTIKSKAVRQGHVVARHIVVISLAFTADNTLGIPRLLPAKQRQSGTIIKSTSPCGSVHIRQE